MSLSVAFAAVLLHTLSNAATAFIGAKDGETEEKKPDAEQTVKLDDPILRLNRFSFHKTVLEENGNQVKNWIVLFCPAWFEPCQALEPHYAAYSRQFEEQLNGALMSTTVRFAAVDCATEKALCNTQDIGMEYPQVLHYKEHKKVAVWRGRSLERDNATLGKFLNQELASQENDSEPEIDEEEDIEKDHEARKDLLLIFAAIAGNAWLISRSSASSNESHRSPEAAAQPPTAKQAASVPVSCASAADSESTARLLPKEWARDRASIEL
mmetsp:Transcript_162507/g.296704  ORF Transcript_162507/g.296704 Transcript_162507/m.296704 type:complete len:268 (-) Transcript_162507:41-844(-)